MNYAKLLWKLYKLKHNTKKTEEQISAMQHKSLYKLLHYAYDHSAYYKVSFEQAGITKEKINSTPIAKFPTINKKILMDNFDQLVTISDVKQEELRVFDEQTESSEIYKGVYHVVHSSGSTGKPGYFIYDDDAWNQMLLAIIRGALWDMSMRDILRFLWNTPRIVYVAASDGRYGGAMAVSSGIEGVHAKQLSLDIKQPIVEWIDQIKTFNPNILIGYPSAIKILAELVETGKVKTQIERIISCGEPLNANLRTYLERTFRCTVVNIYGASESLAIGVGIQDAEGMFLFDDMNYVEVIDDRMYLTSLYNYAQPLIRYELSDRIIWEEKGRFPFTRIKNVSGRSEDLMWFEDGNGQREFLHPLAIEGFCIEGMLDYQFIQMNSTLFELNIETTNEANRSKIYSEMKQALQNMIDEKKMTYVQFIILFVDEILPNKQTGKKQLIMQEGSIEV